MAIKIQLVKDAIKNLRDLASTQGGRDSRVAKANLRQADLLEYFYNKNAKIATGSVTLHFEILNPTEDDLHDIARDIATAVNSSNETKAQINHQEVN